MPGQDDPLTRQALAGLQLPPGQALRQRQSAAWQKTWSDFAAEPGVAYSLTEPTRWRSLHGRPREAFDGRLFGGCLDTLVHVAGSVHADGAGFIQRHRLEGAILYLENAEGSPGHVVRAFHRLRWAGWLDGLAGVLLGRSAAPEPGGEHALRHDDALRQTFGTLPCPVLADVDIGHVPPQMVLVNGAHAQVRWSAQVTDVTGTPWGGGVVTQRFD